MRIYSRPQQNAELVEFDATGYDDLSLTSAIGDKVRTADGFGTLTIIENGFNFYRDPIKIFSVNITHSMNKRMAGGLARIGFKA
jgi:hypothetical protein